MVFLEILQRGRPYLVDLSASDYVGVDLCAGEQLGHRARQDRNQASLYVGVCVCVCVRVLNRRKGQHWRAWLSLDLRFYTDSI